jgi:RNA polymerase sigma-70 factor (ECF subfamily)
VQETFLALWNRAELFDPNAGSLPAWLHAIGRNRAVDRLRAAGRRPRLVAITGSGAPDESETAGLERAMASGTVVAGAAQLPSPEESADAAGLRDAIRTAISAMPDQERTVILLAYQEELTQTEIADRLNSARHGQNHEHGRRCSPPRSSAASTARQRSCGRR